MVKTACQSNAVVLIIAQANKTRIEIPLDWSLPWDTNSLPTPWFRNGTNCSNGLGSGFTKPPGVRLKGHSRSGEALSQGWRRAWREWQRLPQGQALAGVGKCR